MTAVLSVLVADDEPIARRRLIRLLHQREGVMVVGEAGNPDQAVAVALRLNPDILLLDIEMPGGDGFAVLDRLGPSAPATIFVTAHDAHALRAFDKAAVDYVTKPVDPARLAIALNRAAEAVNARSTAGQISQLSAKVRLLREALDGPVETVPVLWVRERHGLRRVILHEISHIRAERDYVRLHLGNGAECLHAESMAALQTRLEPYGFLRVHRSHLVQIAAVIALNRQRGGAMMLTLSDQTQVTVGSSYLAAVRLSLLTGVQPERLPSFVPR
jgi:DNA-binding LytR/AlgR family response regulator